MRHRDFLIERRNLFREGVSPEQVLVTGNTGIDALKWLTGRLAAEDRLRAKGHGELLDAGVRG